MAPSLPLLGFFNKLQISFFKEVLARPCTSQICVAYHYFIGVLRIRLWFWLVEYSRRSELLVRRLLSVCSIE